MSNLKYSELVKRLIRQDSPTELGEPTRPFIETAVRDHKSDEAIQWLDYYLTEQAAVVYLFSVWNWYMVRYYLDHKPESTLQDVMQLSMSPWIGTTIGLKGNPSATVTIEDADVILNVEQTKSPIYIIDEIDRYTILKGSPEDHEHQHRAWRQEIESAIQNHDLQETVRLLDSLTETARLTHDIHADWAWALITLFIHEWGEPVLGEVLRVTEEPWVTVRYANLKDMSQEESLQLTVEGMRAHFTGPGRTGLVKIDDESDRWVMSFDACGSGGRMRRGDPIMGSGSRLEAPYNFLNIEGAYDWTWQEKDVCAYCSHCAMVNQILPIEGMEHPMRMVEYPKNPDDPCRWIIYKDENTYPDEAYTNVGKPPKKMD